MAVSRSCNIIGKSIRWIARAASTSWHCAKGGRPLEQGDMRKKAVQCKLGRAWFGGQGWGGYEKRVEARGMVAPTAA